MALSATRLVTGQVAYAADVKQFYDLFTGAMTDQVVTFANVLNLTKAGTGLNVTNNAVIGGTLNVAADTNLGNLTTSAISCTTLTSRVNGAAGGLRAGALADVSWYRDVKSVNAEWVTSSGVTIEGANGSLLRILANPAGTVPVGVGNYVTFTGKVNVTAVGGGVGAIKFSDAVNRDNFGFLKIFVDAVAYYIPFFASN